MPKSVLVSMDEEVLADFDKIRGMIQRSPYIVKLMRDEVKRCKSKTRLEGY